MRLSIAIPDSSLADEKTKVNKTRKISLMARACAIFRVKTVYIYQDKTKAGKSEEGKENRREDKALLKTMLRFIETPPYLRRKLFPKVNELKFAGSINPLKTPHHTVTSDPAKIRQGNIRDGIVVFYRGQKYIDAGLEEAIPYSGSEKAGTRITVEFKDVFPYPSVKVISKEKIRGYWGYEVKETENLRSFLSSLKNEKIILTSSKGPIVHKNQKLFEEIHKADSNHNQQYPVTVVFGSTNRGVEDILGTKQIGEIQNSKLVNFFPTQATQTVRLEEAILGVLSIINVLCKK